ncbi:MAG TPA: phosphatase PAP2 family protein [Bacteroidales bacterium]|jgi:undecaprenyl-diphosphatase|nr:phosphatase PAP2 family protein [Bacteroidales bacterium]
MEDADRLLMPMEQIDQQLFLFLNSANSPFWDDIMFFLNMKLVWAPLYLAILVWMGMKFGKKIWILLLLIALAIFLSDRISVLIKDLVARPRPCHETSLQGLVHMVRGICGGSYGFVSSHAANSFNVAFLSLLLFRKKWYTVFIILWASAVSYSRIYLGVHYPGDIVGGAVLGAFIGWGICKLFSLYERKTLVKV